MKKIFLLLGFLASLFASAESGYIVLDKANCGLSNDNIHCILQDSRGYVWIGTEIGLNRFDGTRMVSFKAQDYRLSSNYIFSLYEDNGGNIWIGTARGVACYDYQSDSFFVPKQDDGTYPQDVISSFAGDVQGRVWFSPNAEGNLYFYDPSKGQLIRHCASLEMGPKYLAFDSRNHMILIAGEMMYDFDQAQNTLTRLYDHRMPDASYRHRLRGPILLPGDDAMIYFATEKALMRLDRNSLSAKELHRWAANQVPVMLVLSSDNELVVPTSKGLFTYNIDTGEGSTCFKDEFCIGYTVSQSGGRWVGTFSNGLRYSGPENLRFKDVRSDAGITCFAQDDEGTLWLASRRGGLCTFDPHSRRLSRVASRGLPPSINTLCCYGGRLFAGTDSGFYLYGPKSGVARRIDPSPILYDFLDDTGRPALFVGDRNCIYAYDDVEERIAPVSGYTLPAEAAQKGFVRDSSGVFWIPTYVSGLFAFDPSRQEFIQKGLYDDTEESRRQEMISSVLLDRSGYIWTVGYGAELCRISASDGSRTYYNHRNVPAFPEATFLSAVQSEDGMLWVSTSSGLLKFDPLTRSVEVFHSRNGLPDDVFTGACLSLSSGELLFATSSGLVLFDPDDFKDTVRRVDVVSMKIGDRPVHPKQNLNGIKRFTLPQSRNSFGFGFALPGGVFSGTLRCRLKNYEPGWRSLGPDCEVYYYNVPPGKYVLEITGHEDVAIEIIPPFWTTPGGIFIIVICVLAVAAFLGLLIVMRRERKRKEQERERLISEKMDFLSGFVAFEQFEAGNPEMLFMKKLDEVVTEHLSDDHFGIEELARELSMSHRSLTRHTSAAFNTTPSDYIRTKRIAVASHLLSQGDLSVSEVAFRCGFSSPSYFAKCYKDVYGVPPSAAIPKQRR